MLQSDCALCVCVIADSVVYRTLGIRATGQLNTKRPALLDIPDTAKDVLVSFRTEATC